MQAQMAAYLDGAGAVAAGPATDAALAEAATRLPPPDLNLLAQLAAHSEAAAVERPRLGWAIAALAEAAALAQGAEEAVAAQAAWHVARAANWWANPPLVEAAAQRAEARFRALGEAGWLAAGRWQLNALSWARPNYDRAAAELAQALAALEAHGAPPAWRWLCRLDLAYAQIMIGQYGRALELVGECERAAGGEELELARCGLVRSSVYRRQSRYQEALECLDGARTAFTGRPIEQARCDYQIAYVRLRFHDDYGAAEGHFRRAAAVFEERELPLWLALCLTGLAEASSNAGLFDEADDCVRRSREICAAFAAPGPWADSLFDSGVLESLRGNLQVSQGFFGRAAALYDRLGSPRMTALTRMLLGENCRLLGRYQVALHYLEQAHTDLEQLHEPERQAECEMRLAHLWTQLNRSDLAHGCLDAATAYYQATGQPAFLAAAYHLRAQVYFGQEGVEEALRALQQALAVAEAGELLLPQATSRRLLGEALEIAARAEESVAQLAAAAESLAEIGLPMEQAACQAALGRVYARLEQPAAARRAWQQALALSRELLPDLVWQARSGLGQLDEAAGDDAAALGHYHQAIRALAHLRRGFWQPALAGSYLRRPAAVFDQAVSLAARAGTEEERLTFIEAGKAQTLLRYLAMGRAASARMANSGAGPGRLAELAEEIRWLQKYLQASYGQVRGPRPAEEMRLRRELKARASEYDRRRGRLERARAGGQAQEQAAERPFDPGVFRDLACDRLGQEWLALDYYLAGDVLLVMVVTAASCETVAAVASGPARLALDVATRDRHGGARLTGRDLAALGKWLLPAEARRRLRPDSHLIIAPHRRLHRLPWAALRLNSSGRPLVAACVPCVAPSLHTMARLWERPAAAATGNGLVLAVPAFPGRYDPLPAALPEAERLAAIMGPGTRSLRAEAATWDGLVGLARAEDGLAGHAFWHVASHAFYDPVTGRLSAIALHDRDVWLDELWELAPLPALVTLSACSAIQSRVYAGDEHVGLAATCLAAGAQSVVGSLWPVGDESAAGLILTFYERLAAGRAPAEALALAQRQAAASHRPAGEWGGFLNIGLP